MPVTVFNSFRLIKLYDFFNHSLNRMEFCFNVNYEWATYTVPMDVAATLSVWTWAVASVALQQATNLLPEGDGPSLVILE